MTTLWLWRPREADGGDSGLSIVLYVFDLCSASISIFDLSFFATT